MRRHVGDSVSQPVSWLPLSPFGCRQSGDDPDARLGDDKRSHVHAPPSLCSARSNLPPSPSRGDPSGNHCRFNVLAQEARDGWPGASSREPRCDDQFVSVHGHRFVSPRSRTEPSSLRVRRPRFGCQGSPGSLLALNARQGLLLTLRERERWALARASRFCPRIAGVLAHTIHYPAERAARALDHLPLQLCIRGHPDLWFPYLELSHPERERTNARPSSSSGSRSEF